MVIAVIVRALDLLVQLVLILLGALLIDAEDSATGVYFLLLWSGLGTLYWLASVIAVGVSVRRGPERVPAWVGHLDTNRAIGVVSAVATYLASLVGLIAVGEILLLRNDPEWQGFIEVVAVYTMLLAWALFHWGFARIYERRYRRSDVPPLVFPGTEHPRLVDFVYFSFTNATAFSVSDVQVMTSRMRWTVVWHTTLSFFLNALIIVFAFTTIINA